VHVIPHEGRTGRRAARAGARRRPHRGADARSHVTSDIEAQATSRRYCETAPQFTLTAVVPLK
jgi:hypothetical protein